MEVKEVTKKKDFYLTILNSLKDTTNLSKIQKRLSISKQNLNYYLRRLKKEGLVENDAYGSWKLTKQSKNVTKYGKLLSKDSVRGHGNVVTLSIQEIEDWKNRISILESKGIHFKLVGAKLNTPRIKVLGRKVWLCNKSIRIYDKPDESYYGINAIQSRVLAFNEFKKIISILENKLGIRLNPSDIEFKKEHFALIKNDLAIEHNQKGEILRVKDESGEWLIVDDSLGKGGELETIGKKALVTNIPMQKWWNDMKETKFEVTPRFILNSINQVTQNQVMFNKNFESHVQSIKSLGHSATANATSVELLAEVVRELKDEIVILKEIIKKNENEKDTKSL